MGSPDDVELHVLLRRAREGSKESAEQLIRVYGDPIRRAIRRTLQKPLRRIFDTVDFEQMVWNSVFRNRHDLDRFNDPEELLKFVMGMVRNKVEMETRHYLHTQKRTIYREQGADTSSPECLDKMPDRRPEPIDEAIAREQFERLLRDRPKLQRKIVQLRFQGKTNQEIAVETGIAESTVDVVLQTLWRRNVRLSTTPIVGIVSRRRGSLR